ncbi:hypothetical protein [Bordetella flabilis]|uniref:Uncharacterized protein n=1 Tax=Bordetella flabilis TaxID=463014 RepID=A0A193GH43_9BORD|nr:hypothetical protein [Bordetella flabilis]ANN78908.1 hypothetical protein BAU07_18870 [Bordetella flabilis]
MAIQQINVGTAPNDGTGDPIRTAFVKANANFQDLDGRVAAAIPTSQRGAVNGVAPLGADAKVPAVNLPSYVDDVVEVQNNAALPQPGESGKIYVVLNDSSGLNNVQYRWSGSAYVEIVASPGTTDNVPEGVTNKYFTEARVLSVVSNRLRVYTYAGRPTTDVGPIYIVGLGPCEFNTTFNGYLPLVRYADCYVEGGGAANSVRLSRFRGSRLTVLDKHLPIPGSGVEIVPTGIVQGSVNYLYAYDNSGSLGLEYSTTPGAVYAATGDVVKPGDPSRLLVGFFTMESNQIIDSLSARCIGSFFNRRPKTVTSSVPSAATASTTPVFATGRRIMCWAGETLDMKVSGAGTTSQALQAGYYALAIGTTNIVSYPGIVQPSTANQFSTASMDFGFTNTGDAALSAGVTVWVASGSVGCQYQLNFSATTRL